MNLVDLFLESIENHKVYSFIGMAKNVGKTTTFNYIIENLKSKYILGLTSIGRDGEQKDILTEQSKPEIKVTEGNLLATAQESLKRSIFPKKVIFQTNISSAIGKIVIVKSKGSGTVELSGPSLIQDLRSTCGILKKFGAELILIDGAFNRKSFASPILAHATILATGAALSHDLEELIEETRHTVNKLMTPPLKNVKIKQLILTSFKSKKAVLINQDLTIKNYDVNTALNASKSIVRDLDSRSRYIVIRGIVSSDLIQKLLDSNKNLSKIIIVAEDATKFFISKKLISRYTNSGGSLRVLYPIKLIAVTSNPVSPYGFNFDPSELLSRLQKELPIPVYDVVLGG